MDPFTVTALLLLGAGLAATMSGCGSQEEANKEAVLPENKPIPEADVEEELNGKTDSEETGYIVSGATVMCTNAEEIKSDSHVMKSTETNAPMTQSSDELCQYDSKIKPLFHKCTAFKDGKCIYDEEVEIWEAYDSRKELGENKYGLLKTEAFLVCLAGEGLIFATDDGQLVGKNGREIAIKIIKRWVQNSDAVSDQLLREAGILASQNGENYFTAIDYKFAPEFLTEGMQLLKDMELDTTKKKEYIQKDDEGNIAVYPYYVGDGVITFGYGVAMNEEYLDKNYEKNYKMYQYYRTVYAPDVNFNGPSETAIKIKDIPPIPLKELDQMFEYTVREKFQDGINEFEEENGLEFNQNEYDAMIIMKYNMGHIPKEIREAVIKSKDENMPNEEARKTIRQSVYNYYKDLNNAETFMDGWMNRTDETLNLYFKDISS